MEESEKRKERLKAMRMEAAEVEDDAASGSSGLASGCLSNPLIESSSPAPSQYTSSRFDYYTDPMSAFSGGRRRNNNTPQVLQGHYNTPPRPVSQGMTPAPVYHSQVANSPGQRIYQAPGYHFNQSPVGSPLEFFTPSVRPLWHPPNTWGGSRGSSFNYSTPPPNLSRDGKFRNPGFSQGNSPCVSNGQGRGQRFNTSSHYDSGRSRGQSLGNSPSPRSGMGGRRGFGSLESVSAEERPDLFYRKEMVEDPWKMLTPIIWKDFQSQDSNKSWLPKSISMKKAKVFGEASQASISQQSLVEYLAASFNESTDEAVDDENRGP